MLLAIFGDSVVLVLVMFESKIIVQGPLKEKGSGTVDSGLWKMWAILVYPFPP